MMIPVRAAVAACVIGLVSASADAAEPGRSYLVTPADLPAPYAMPSARNPPERIERPAEAAPAAPDGFSVRLFAENLDHPRTLAIAPNGDVFVAQSRLGAITVLRDEDGDGVAETRSRFAAGFSRPHGMVFHDGALHVADTEHVWRLPYSVGMLEETGKRQAVTPPGALGPATGHWTRNLIFHPDGDRFFVAIGSAGNIAEEPSPRASIQAFTRDGTPLGTFADGLRNPVGLAYPPGGGDLYTVVNERDGMGDGLVPDYLTRVSEGGFYGWPYAYIGSNPQPGFADRRPDLVERAIVPDVLFQAHSAPIGLVFYDHDAFPAEYRGDAFVALRGSWNSTEPTGYKVVRVPFEDGRPSGGYQDFVVGFRMGGETTARVWGRPAGLAVAADGALLIADDTGGTIWRVVHHGGDKPGD